MVYHKNVVLSTVDPGKKGRRVAEGGGGVGAFNAHTALGVLIDPEE